MTLRKRYIKGLLNKKLYLILDYGLVGDRIKECASAVLDTEVKVIQIRAKNISDAKFFSQAYQIREITKDNGITLIINNRIDIALAVEADGVHLGQDDVPLIIARKLLGEKIIGISTHNLIQAKKAQRDGADYIGVGPIFKTNTKLEAGIPLGIELITQIKQAVTIPVVAIGGINEDNIQQVLNAGADMVAVASAILKQMDIAEAIKRLMRATKQNHETSSYCHNPAIGS